MKNILYRILKRIKDNLNISKRTGRSVFCNKQITLEISNLYIFGEKLYPAIYIKEYDIYLGFENNEIIEKFIDQLKQLEIYNKQCLK